MSGLVLYGMDISPPVRACLLTLKALELPFEYKIVNLLAGEHITEEFRKHNPQHTVPVLDDHGNWIWDSHVICAYLVDKYGKNDALYPKELVQRARLHQRLYFDASILYMSLRNISMPMFRNNVTVVPSEKTQNIIEGYELMEVFLADKPYITGDKITIADFCCVATVSSLRGVVDIGTDKYPKLCAWLERMTQLPYYEECNGKGAKEYIGILKSKLTEINV